MRIFFLLIFFLSSCDFFDGLTLSPNAPVKSTLQSSQTQIKLLATPPPSAEPLSSCAKILSSFDGSHQVEILAENQVKVALGPSVTLINMELPAWALKLSDEIFGKTNCPYTQVNFELTRPEGQLVRFKIFRVNFTLYQSQKISLPEFGRRLEIEEVATLVSVKSHLRIARAAGHHDEALRWVEEWLQLEPESALPLALKGNIFLDMKDYPKAIGIFEKVLTILPKDRVARFNLAVAQKEIGSFADTIRLLEELKTEVDAEQDAWPERQNLLLHLADACLRNNESEKAQALLATLSAADFPAVEIFRAEALRSQKKFAETKTFLEGHLKSHPDDAMARYDLVLSFLDLKDEEGAKMAFQDLKKRSAALAAELEFVSLFKETKIVAPVVNPAEQQEFLDEE